MKSPTINESVLFNLVTVVISAIVSWFSFLMGAGHLIEAMVNPNPNIPAWEAMLGGTICVLLCVIGVLSFWVMIKAIKGLYRRFESQ